MSRRCTHTHTRRRRTLHEYASSRLGVYAAAAAVAEYLNVAAAVLFVPVVYLLAFC